MKRNFTRPFAALLLAAAFASGQIAAPLAAFADDGGTGDASAPAASPAPDSPESDAGASDAADAVPALPDATTTLPDDAAAATEEPGIATSTSQDAADEATTTDEGTSDSGAADTDASSSPAASQSVTPDSDTVLFQTSTSASGADATTTSTTTATAASATTTATTTIATGSAFSIADILNLLNTNFLNSAGVIDFSNFLTTTGTIDARAGALLSSMLCSLTAPCTSGNDVSLNFLNSASVDNQVTVQAASGGNTIASTTNGQITTGNAFAGLNLINLANTNFTDANYYLLTLNAFQDVDGDIVLPSLADFFDTGNSTATTNLSLANDGTASNDVSAASDSGGNSATATSSTIATGASLSYTNVVNQLNTDIANDNLSVLFNIGGAWNGQIFDLPDGVSWTETGNGILFSSNGSAPSIASAAGSLSEDATNTAAIHNQVSVTASSGENSIQDTDAAAITTGDALAAANVINVANTNIIGTNWLLAIINIFGDLNGNIAFGRPDLWVGDQILNAPQHIQDGDALTYKLTVRNRGDAAASNAIVTVNPDAQHLTIEDASLPFVKNGDGSLSWSLGSMAPDATQDITFTADVHDAPSGTQITAASNVSEHETDDNDADNSDSVSFYTSDPSSGSSYYHAPDDPTPSGDASSTDAQAGPVLKVVRTPERASPTGLNRAVHEMIALDNMSSMPATGVTLHDIIKAPDGTVIDDEPWNIGTIGSGEEVQVAYDANFADDAPAGDYALSTEIAGTNVPAQEFDGNGVITLAAEAPTAAAAGEVLGTSTAAVSAAASSTPVSVAHKKQPSALGNAASALTTNTALAAAAGAVPNGGRTMDDAFSAIVLLLVAGALYLGSKYADRKKEY